MPLFFAPEVEHPICTLTTAPWEIAVKPFQVAPRTYYVSGQSWVSAYLIDTGEGCILIDTGVPESLYLLIDSIYRLGFLPEDIRMILLSHAHFDHCGAAGALRALTGAPVYLSREDAGYLRECPEETMMPGEGCHTQFFAPDRLFGDHEVLQLGDIAVETLHTPGHTGGTTSFFWNVQNPATNETYRVAMHGGVGAFSMSDEYYARSRCLTPDLRDRFLKDCEALKQRRVDIALPSHPSQIDILSRAGNYSDESQPYLDATVWIDFLEKRAGEVRALIK